jgi:hypothetical protein
MSDTPEIGLLVGSCFVGAGLIALVSPVAPIVGGLGTIALAGYFALRKNQV